MTHRLMIVALLGLAACEFTEQQFEDKAGPALCAKFAECIEGFDEDACNNPEDPVDTSSCTYNADNAKECYDGIEDAPCGTEEEFYIPDLPAACDSVYTDCGE